MRLALIAIVAACAQPRPLVRTVTVVGDAILVEKCAIEATPDERDIGDCWVTKLDLPQPTLARSRAELGLPEHPPLDPEPDACIARRRRAILLAKRIANTTERVRALAAAPECPR